MSVKDHRKKTPQNLKVAVLSISSTRTHENDESGLWMCKRSAKEGHTIVFHQVIPDDEAEIRKKVRDVIREYNPDMLLLTGGTGIGSADVTIEAVTPMFKKEMTSFAPVFAQLSFEKVDSAAILSRASAGIINDTVIFSLPGSLKACKLACKTLIFPEAGHIVKHLRE